MAIKRGAPFDKNNLWNVPAIDGGGIVPDAFAKIYNGQAIGKTPPEFFNGGFIPLKGTATYDPSKRYGPNSPLIED